jgi:hypothetical protein
MVEVVCVEQPQASWEERSMKHYAGLDVSVKETSICIVDEAGRICREMKLVRHPEDLLAVLCDPAWRLERVGLEAGPLSQWLFSGLAEAGVPAICVLVYDASSAPRLKNRLDFCRKGRIAMGADGWTCHPVKHLGLASRCAGLWVVRASIPTPRTNGA